MTRTLTAVAAGLVVAVFASISSAQVFYLPVQYQYGQEETYYYGGSDPAIFRHAERTTALRSYNEIENEPLRIYSDLLPFRNMRLIGFTIDDARNEAYANAPRYFRKGDLMRSAVEVEGAVYVPATAPRRYGERIPLTPAVAPAAEEKKGVIIIIPRKPAKQDNLSKPAMFVAAD